MNQQSSAGGFERIYQQMEHYYQLALRASCPWQKLQYETMLLKEAEKFMQKIRLQANTAVPEKQFTLAELAQYDGSGGKPAYVAVNGIVYDVSNEATWGGGTHFGLYAGKDLTAQFGGCHGMPVILAGLPKVGTLVKE